MVHETLWITQNLGTAPTPGRNAPGRRPELERGCSPHARVGGVSVSMAARLGRRSRGGVSPQAGARPAAQADRPAMRTVGAALTPGGPSAWVRERAVDLTAHRGDDSGALWGALSSRARLEALAPLRVELSGAGAARQPTGRAGHRPLEALHLAGAKKKPNDLGPISPFWMRAASCSSPTGAAFGRPGGTPPSYPTTTSMTASRHWRHSLFRPSASTWACTCASSRATSRPLTSPPSCARSCGIFEDPSFCSGTVARFTGGQPSRQYARPTPGCTWKSSRRMRRSSIRRSRSGTTSKAARPTVCYGTHGISAVVWLRTPAGSATRRRSCAPSSGVPSCHCHHEGIYIPYANLNKAIRASDFILIFLSKNSIPQRGYVQTEFKLTLDAWMRVPQGMIHTIPVRLDDSEIPDQFRKFHWCNLFEADGFE